MAAVLPSPYLLTRPPALYSLLVAADVVLDRMITFCNINGDAMICRIINEQVDETLTGEIMRNHEQIATM